MRVAVIGAGSGRDYCGSCFQTAELVRGLRAIGVDALLVPTYLPLEVDDEPLPQSRIFFSGINVFLEQFFPLWRRLPAWVHRCWESRRLLRLIGRFSGTTRPEKLGPLTLSMLRGEDGNQRREIDNLADFLGREFRPDILHLSTGLLVGVGRALRQRLNVPVVATLGGEDGFLERLPSGFRTACRNLTSEGLRQLAAVVAPSRFYAARCVDYFGLDPRQVVVIPPGVRQGVIPPAAPADKGQARRKDRVTIGYLGRICAPKGVPVLVEALRILADQLSPKAFSVVLAGRVDGPFRRSFRLHLKMLRQRGVTVDYWGPIAPAEKEHFFRTIDFLVLPSGEPEPKAVTAIEAVSRHIPVIAPAHGALLEIIGRTGLGELYWPNTAERLAALLVKWLEGFSHGHLGYQKGSPSRAVDYYRSLRYARQTVGLYQRLIGLGHDP